MLPLNRKWGEVAFSIWEVEYTNWQTSPGSGQWKRTLPWSLFKKCEWFCVSCNSTSCSGQEKTVKRSRKGVIFTLVCHCGTLHAVTAVVFLSVLCCRKLHNQLCPPIPSAAPGSPTKGTSSTSHTPSLCQQTLACRSRVSPHHTSIHSCFSFIYLIKFGFLLHVASLEPGS